MSQWLIQSDSRHIPLADDSVQCVVTSPPYYGLRNYGVDGQIGLEQAPDCLGWATANPCGTCYVCQMVAVFREVRRVLRPDGVCFVNLGDTYATLPYSDSHIFDPKYGGRNRRNGYPNRQPGVGIRHKNLIGIPWRVALALQADGWYLRQDIIWAKPNPMPESVRDRCTKSHEYLFLLAKSERYFWDGEAISESSVRAGCIPRGGRATRNAVDSRVAFYRPENGIKPVAAKRNARSVWTIATQSYCGAHFATFPIALARRCIQAGTSERGRCPECGKAWVRVVEKRPTGKTQKMADGWATHAGGHGSFHKDGREAGQSGVPVMAGVTVGWRAACECGREPVPCVVFDPFVGAGSTLVAAQDLGRDGVGTDLSADYLRQAKERIATAGQPRRVRLRRSKPEWTLFTEVA